MSDIIDLDEALCDAIDRLPGDAALQREIEKGLAAADLKTDDRIATRQLRQIMAHGTMDMLRLLPFRSSREGVFTPPAWAELVAAKSPVEVREMGRRGAALSNAMLAICTAACRDSIWDDLAVEMACDEPLMIETLLGHDLFAEVCRDRPDLAARMLVDLADARPLRELANAFRTFADAGFISAFAALWSAPPNHRFDPDLFEYVGPTLGSGATQDDALIAALARATSNHARLEMKARLPELEELIANPAAIYPLDKEYRARLG